MDMDTVLTVIQMLFFIAMIVLSVYLIISLNKITSSVKTIENEVADVSNSLTPLLAEVSEVVKDVGVLSENIKNDYAKAEPVINDLIEKGKDLSNVVGKVKDVLTGVTKSVFPVVTGVTTALKFLKK